MISKDQNTAIQTNFDNSYALPKEKDIEIAICKHTTLMKPRNDARSHAAADLKNAYANNKCPVNREEDWYKTYIEYASTRRPHLLAGATGTMSDMYLEIEDKVKMHTTRSIIMETSRETQKS